MKFSQSWIAACIGIEFLPTDNSKKGIESITCPMQKPIYRRAQEVSASGKTLILAAIALALFDRRVAILRLITSPRPSSAN